VPVPTTLSIRAEPAACSHIAKTCARPSPVPALAALVVNSGSKARCTTAAGIPSPLADVSNDVEVSARGSKISDANFVRLRRAMDRVACAQSVLETMMAESVGAKCDETGMRMRMRMREAVELLARGWPEDYQAGAVEWLMTVERAVVVLSRR
jgi:hypothetical protein